MADQVTIPNGDEIRRDLEYMVSDWAELSEPAMFEIRAFRENAHPQTAKFAPDWISEAVEWIEGMNALGFNIYAVRNPIRASISGSASDTDIIAARFLWADCDDPAAAGNVLRFDGPKWAAAVKTGSIPSPRVHTYWRLDEWCHDLAAWRAMQSAIAAHFGSDPSVINPSRIMRVAGTVSYPNSRKSGLGYVREMTTLRTEYPDVRAPVTMDQMARVFAASTPAKAPAPAFAIDTGFAPPLDRERAVIQAMSGAEWHNAVIRLVASYVGKGLSDAEIHSLTDPLTLSGYTVDQTRAEVQQAIDGARRKGWTPETQYADPAALQPPQIQPQTDPDFDAPKRAADLEWFDDVAPSLTDAYLIKGVLAAGAMSVIYGPSNSGKTFFALDMAFGIATGAPWHGRRVHQSAVLYLAAEGGRAVLNRVAALRAEHGILDVPLAIKRAGLDLLHDQADLQHIADLAAEVGTARPGKPLMIIIDTLSRIMAGGDENSAADMTALIRNIDAVRSATGAHVMLVHHTGKDSARGARGHSSLRAATDTEIEVGNDNGARSAMVTKQRDYPGGEVFNFTLKSVALGHDQDGDEVTSCVVETVSDAEMDDHARMLRGLGGNQKLIADTFDQMIGEGLGRPNPGGVGMPEPGKFMCVDRAELRRLCIGKIVAADPRSSFNKALGALITDRGLFVGGENLVWRIDRRITQ